MSKKNSSNAEVFIEITNKDIWDKIEDSIETMKELKVDLTQLKEDNKLGHQSIVDRQDYTNGKVKNNRKMIYLLSSMLVSSFIFLISILIKHIGG